MEEVLSIVQLVFDTIAYYISVLFGLKDKL